MIEQLLNYTITLLSIYRILQSTDWIPRSCEISLKFYSKIRHTVAWSRLGNIFPFDHAIEVTLTHEPSRWWHRSRRAPARSCPRASACVRAYVRTCNVRGHDVPFARGAAPTGPRTRLRLSSANGFRFSTAVGCHVKLHRRAFLSHGHVYTRRHWRRACRGVRCRIGSCPGWADPTFTHVPSQLSRVIVSCWFCQPHLRIARHVGRSFREHANSADSSILRSRCFARSTLLFLPWKDHGIARVDFWWPPVNI